MSCLQRFIRHPLDQVSCTGPKYFFRSWWESGFSALIRYPCSGLKWWDSCTQNVEHTPSMELANLKFCRCRYKIPYPIFLYPKTQVNMFSDYNWCFLAQENPEVFTRVVSNGILPRGRPKWTDVEAIPINYAISQILWTFPMKNKCTRAWVGKLKMILGHDTHGGAPMNPISLSTIPNFHRTTIEDRTTIPILSTRQNMTVSTIYL